MMKIANPILKIGLRARRRPGGRTFAQVTNIRAKRPGDLPGEGSTKLSPTLCGIPHTFILTKSLQFG
jgi:hypothetical protein